MMGRVFDYIISGCILAFMGFVLLVALPVAIVSIGWEVGKDIKEGKKVRWWGAN